jgi:hypothetical protein
MIICKACGQIFNGAKCVSNIKYIDSCYFCDNKVRVPEEQDDKEGKEINVGKSR